MSKQAYNAVISFADHFQRQRKERNKRQKPLATFSVSFCRPVNDYSGYQQLPGQFQQATVGQCDVTFYHRRNKPGVTNMSPPRTT